MDPKDERNRDGVGEDRDVEKARSEAKETRPPSSEPPPPKSEAKPSKVSESKPESASRAKREEWARAREDRKRAPAATSPSTGSSQAIVIAVVALAVGGAA